MGFTETQEGSGLGEVTAGLEVLGPQCDAHSLLLVWAVYPSPLHVSFYISCALFFAPGALGLRPTRRPLCGVEEGAVVKESRPSRPGSGPPVASRPAVLWRGAFPTRGSE